ncbi:tripartite motif-containing protein 16-like protein [Chanos chanos]|uniref:Tripartite motif-containing protein 16-like protein n=1 Tax=Chanos chanos TaxID=29144 RepID=A0A6J2VN08_CHACN|nr:tripartite motif-containing protein 16-like protein [Chanos chanos]
MAEASISVGQDQFMCPVCLDLLKDPVTIPCGHSYCMGCIKGYWDQDDQKGVYSCPRCRQTFTPRPALASNTMLAEMVEELKRRRLEASSEGQQEKICPRHNALIEFCCHTDHQFLCYVCLVDEHRDHKTVSVAAERTERQKQLLTNQRKTQQRIQEREKEVQELRQAVESLRRSAQAAVEDSERIFIELIRSIERRCREVTELIRDQEKSELSQAEGVLERLEQEIADLRRRDTELEQLSQTEDHVHFLQIFPSLCAPPGLTDFPSITVSPHLSFEDVGKSVSQLKEQVEDFCKEFGRLSTQVTNVNIFTHVEPRTREEFLQYSCNLTLDPNTVNKHLLLSEGNRVVTYIETVKSYPDHPERFDKWYQVLCRESVSERCYWETDWSGDYGVSIAVSYRDISRKGGGNECVFGCNGQSWGLFLSPSRHSFRHNDEVTQLPTVPSSSRIGVYVDHRAGTLSFYSVSDTMTLLHRVHTTFTQPLYPGFWVNLVSQVKVVPLFQ